MNREQSSRGIRTETFGLRLTPDELEALERSATEAGESVAEYVRKAISSRQQGRPDIPALNVSVGMYSLQIEYHHAAWGDAPASTTPEDFPTHLTNAGQNDTPSS